MASDDSTQGYLSGGNAVAVTTPGSGYTATPTAVFGGGGCVTQPTATLGAVGGVAVLLSSTPGRGCTTAQAATVSGGGGTGATVGAYPITSLWLYNQRVYQILDNSPGHATWKLLPATRPLDALVQAGYSGMAPIAYGVCRMRGGYTGNAFTLTRSSDSTTLAVPYQASGCVSDTSAIDNFCAGTTCYFTTINDNGTGGADCTAAPSYAPIYVPGQLVRSLMSIVVASYAPSLTNQAALARYCTVSSYASFSPTIGTLIAALSQPTSNMAHALASNGAATYGVLLSSGVSPRGAGVFGVAIGGTLSTRLGPDMFVSSAGTISGAGASLLQMSSNSAVLSQGATIAAQTGFDIGANTTTYPGIFDLTGLVYAPTQLTPVQLTAARGALLTVNPVAVPQQPDFAVVTIGDSWETTGSTTGGSVPKLAEASISRPVTWYNMSVHGTTAQTVHSGNDNACDNYTCAGYFLPKLYAQTGGSLIRKFVVSVKLGANDIRLTGASARSVQQIVNDNQAIVAAANALGPNVVTIMVDQPVQYDVLNNTTQLTALQSLNGIVQQCYAVPVATITGPCPYGGFGAAGLVSVWSNPVDGQANYTSTALPINSANSPDGQHQTDLLQPYSATEYRTAIDAILRSN